MRPVRAPGAARRATGFTLLEVLAVVMLTGIVLGVALDFYVDLSRASTRATEFTRTTRRATAVLDRVARDLEETILVVKPLETDPLAHPWVFMAESRYATGGADQLKFVTRHHRPRREAGHEADLAVVAYTVRRGDDDALELWRWASPRLPDSLDRSFPREEDGALLLAGDLAAFELRFLSENGEWRTTWDSSTLENSSDLPVAVEIDLALAEGEAFAWEEGPRFARQVSLPMRPLDMEILLDPTRTGGGAGSDEDGEEDEDSEGADGEGADGGRRADAGNRTVRDCLHQAVTGPEIRELRQQFQPYLDEPFSAWADVIPSVLIHRSCK